jgi:hypothetical protein
MNNIGIILLLVGGYLLYRYYASSGAGSSPSVTGEPTSQLQAATKPAEDLVITKQLMARKAADNDFFKQQGGLMDWHQWNYIYREVRGIDAPQPSGIDLMTRLSLDEWFAVTFGGVGLIIPRQSIRERVPRIIRTNISRFEKANVRRIV